MDSKFFMGVIVPFSILLPIIIGIIKYKALSESAKLMLLYLIISALFTGIALVVGRYYHKNNMPSMHLFTVFEFVILVAYYKKIPGAGRKNSFYYLLILLFVLLCIANAIFFQSMYTYNSYTKSVEAIVCILFAMNYFAAIAADTTSKKIITQPDFYFNAGFFLYFSGAFILFVFSNFIVSNLSLHNFLIIWTIHASLVLLMYLFFSTAFLLCKK
jgi:hypothetical protein